MKKPVKLPAWVRAEKEGFFNDLETELSNLKDAHQRLARLNAGSSEENVPDTIWLILGALGAYTMALSSYYFYLTLDPKALGIKK